MLKLLSVAAALAVTASVLAGQEHGHDMKIQHMNTGSSLLDTRTLVRFPEQLRIHTMANMRDHLPSVERDPGRRCRGTSSRRPARSPSGDWV